ncbi:hypothetical protein KY284_001446 [Solanum tuberosum]|nr:hypothetical protein KY284_001446 [Solanum tuberosum]
MGEHDEAQRENIFHTRCGIKGRICSMIIDNGSCANVVSTYAVEKLGIPCTKRKSNYKLQWLNECGELKQYDRYASHNGRMNKYSLEHKGKKYILAPLTSSQMYEDQQRLKETMGKHGEGSKQESQKIEREEKIQVRREKKESNNEEK